MKSFTKFLEDMQKDYGTAAMVKKILELYEETPESYRQPTFDCIESTYAANAKYLEDTGHSPGDMLSGIDMEFMIDAVPTLKTVQAKRAAEEKLFKLMIKYGFVFRKDQLDEFPIDVPLGEFVKAVYYNAYEKHHITTFQFSKADVEFCKLHSENPVVPLLYITGILTTSGDPWGKHPMSTLLAAIGLRLIYNHDYDVTFSWFDKPKHEFLGDKDHSMVERGQLVWTLH